VVEAVGRGGFGTVYRAELMGPSGFRKQVALKVLNPDLPEAIGVAERLRDEARLLGMLRHRAIVQVDGLHLLNGRWTVVMEFVEGVDLKQLLAEVGPLSPGLALEIVQEVANALHYAYELSADHSVSVRATRAADGSLSVSGGLRLLHRDIKPGNIQLTAAGEVKVLDFGVARADFADREAQTQSIYFGSLNYMAPERLDGIDEH
jgi:serine/threonine-protein kinase